MSAKAFVLKPKSALYEYAPFREHTTGSLVTSKLYPLYRKSFWRISLVTFSSKLPSSLTILLSAYFSTNCLPRSIVSSSICNSFSTCILRKPFASKSISCVNSVTAGSAFSYIAFKRVSRTRAFIFAFVIFDIVAPVVPHFSAKLLPESVPIAILTSLANSAKSTSSVCTYPGKTLSFFCRAIIPTSLSLWIYHITLC